ncbi:ubiquitin-protein ligase [Thecamonas trahens ATCC 50062]|uniref:RBR-type E3 ubiquitin transferase n=1 Tax=Thecamonas trahens ATCC 50062 TaxID=461836 RepID=A0A0L0DTR7_THETB|nr:ubiquitin-protein ligase [Thecamonas trahens ATCC 50062]KNC55592.1 ubiquitin-protein ligase [Thecamonas trahens ATCC 50062]|eukprot:XP_013761365.1 ubiquitin-protein ligase [Thecamonas trahens ATCC 50062]
MAKVGHRTGSDEKLEAQVFNIDALFSDDSISSSLDISDDDGSSSDQVNEALSGVVVKPLELDPLYKRRNKGVKLSLQTVSWAPTAAGSGTASDAPISTESEAIFVTDGVIFSPLLSGMSADSGPAFAFADCGSDSDDSAHLDAEKGGVVMTPGSLAAEQQAALDLVKSVLGLPELLARTLLDHYGYDTSRMMEEFVDREAEVLAAIGWSEGENGAAASGTGDAGASDSASADAACAICFLDDPAELAALSCGHPLCRDCWSSYLRIKITENDVASIPCPAGECGVRADQAFVAKYVDAAVFDKFQRFLLQNFVTSNKNVVWCPAGGCENAVKVESALEALCACGWRFCPSCNEECHVPVSCAHMREWGKHLAEDNVNKAWILNNTKDCPKCGVTIEKNMGCMHMSCGGHGTRVTGCGHEFCWLCLGDWRTHSHCGRDETAGDRNSKRIGVVRQLHFTSRFEAHRDAHKLELELRSRTVANIAAFRKAHPDSIVKLGYMLDAVEALLYCRKTLQFTYAYAFFLKPDSPEKNLFEYLQGELETSVETLSEAIDLPIDVEHRSKIKKLTRAALRRLNHLLDGVEVGLTTDADDFKAVNVTTDEAGASSGNRTTIRSLFSRRS